MVYENVLSVAFIYALGVKRGRTANPEDIIIDSINFFQQTPKDKCIGDLLAKWNGKAFITEFKATEDRVNDEIKKYGKMDMTKSILSDTELKEFCRRGHFIGYGEFEEKENLVLADMRFKSYLDLLRPNYTVGDKFNRFTERLIDERALGLNDVEMKRYLDFLQEHGENVAEAKTEGGGGGKGKTVSLIEGVVTIVTPDANVILLRYTTYQHLSYLMNKRISLEELLKLQIGYRNNYQISNNYRVEKNAEQDLGESKGSRIR